MAKGIDLTPRWDNFAVYLPSIQKNYASAAYKRGDKERVMPNGITMRDLNFLNPKNKLWHYKYALYSAGQFRVGEQKADIVTNRDTANTIILGVGAREFREVFFKDFMIEVLKENFKDSQKNLDAFELGYNLISD